MSRFQVIVNYKASIPIVVEACDEGDALDKARTIAEESDIREFSLREEMSTEIVNR